MAININDKHALLNKIVPEVEVNHNSSGIIISTERLSESRFIPYDQDGCKECRSTDLVIAKEGVWIWDSKIKGRRFIGFDTVYDLPGYTFVKIRNKARQLKIPHGIPEAVEESAKIKESDAKIPHRRRQREFPYFPTLPKRPTTTPSSIFTLPPPPPPPPPTLPSPPPPPPPPSSPPKAREPAEEFFNGISAATTFLEFAQSPKGNQTEPECKKKIEAQDVPTEFIDEKEYAKGFDEYIECLEEIMKMEQEKEEKNAIATITPIGN